MTTACLCATCSQVGGRSGWALPTRLPTGSGSASRMPLESSCPRETPTWSKALPSNYQTAVMSPAWMFSTSCTAWYQPLLPPIAHVLTDSVITQDRIRRALHPDYYTDPDGHHVNQLHMDHCIDYLRQTIMCHGDMTPVHVHHWESVDRWSPDFESTHTCRNFDKLLHWSLERLRPESEEYWRSGKGSPDWQWD